MALSEINEETIKHFYFDEDMPVTYLSFLFKISSKRIYDILQNRKQVLINKNFHLFTCEFCDISFDDETNFNSHLLFEHKTYRSYCKNYKVTDNFERIQMKLADEYNRTIERLERLAKLKGYTRISFDEVIDLVMLERKLHEFKMKPFKHSNNLKRMIDNRCSYYEGHKCKDIKTLIEHIKPIFEIKDKFNLGTFYEAQQFIKNITKSIIRDIGFKHFYIKNYTENEILLNCRYCGHVSKFKNSQTLSTFPDMLYLHLIDVHYLTNKMYKDILSFKYNETSLQKQNSSILKCLEYFLSRNGEQK